MRTHRLLTLLPRTITTGNRVLPLYKRSVRSLSRPAHRSLLATTTLASTVLATAHYSTSAMSKFYELKAELPNGQTYDFEQLKGKVVLIVNTASKW